MKMRARKWRWTASLPAVMISGALLQSCNIFSYESAYPMTAAGSLEIKAIPESRVLVAGGDKAYFAEADRLFMRLFDYIKRREIAMTVPVEAEMAAPAMRFYVGSGDIAKAATSEGGVRAETAPGRMVVSLGVRGSYTEENYARALAAVREWLGGQNDYSAAGEPYAVFWNGPFTPGFLKRFEVHVPVKPAVAES